MVQLAENTPMPSLPTMASGQGSIGALPSGPYPPPHHQGPMMQQQQLTGDAAAAAQLGRPPPSPATVAPQLASNGSHKTHSKPPSGSAQSRNGYLDSSQHAERRGTGRMEQDSRRRDGTQGQVRLRKDGPDSSYLQNRWSHYGDPRVRMDQSLMREDRHRRWSRDGDGSSWPARDRRPPGDSRSGVSEGAVTEPVKDGVKTEDGESGGGGGGDVGGSETRRRPPHQPHPYQDTPRPPHGPRTLPRHYRDRVRDQDRDRTQDGGGEDRERDRDRNRERDHDRDRQRERDHDRDRERDVRDRDRDRDRDRERNHDRERERDPRDSDRNRERDIRDRERERNRERDREHGEPRRREPVGEETGYDSDHSRMSRSTAVSYSSRSLPRRPRADSITSHVSRASTRAPARPRGYEDMYEMYHQYYPYSQYYKDYYQWVKQYQRQAYQSESFYDDHTSIHSGRSSVNNEPEKSVSSGELSVAPSVGDDTVSEVVQRMTPVHFGRPHISARFTPSGQLVMVLPKDPRDGEKAVVQLRNVQKMLCVDPSESRAIQQMKNYPGPLTMSDTHKDVVMKYCEHQAAEAGKSLTLPDKESVMLIWEYLALLVKQNGKLFGSDIAGLLLKGREVAPAPTLSTPHLEEPLEDVPPDTSPQDEGIDLPSQTPALPPGRDEAALLRKFTEYLCLGRKKEAVDYAIREGLWGHALVLAYKMDTTTHTRVLAAFMSHIPRTDVVLTLFQQLSGKKPEITKSYSPEQWGDWRQHLAVMISNPTGASHKDQASIVALGDTLAGRGQLHAAHFCYLVAGVKWGSYTCKDSKLVLIGASHHLPFQAFATIEAIQCTEVYEFARSLDGNNSPALDTFQSYKLVYALRQTECGFPAEALRYCEVISQSVEKDPTAYKVEFLSQVYDLASRLKYHDLHYQMYQGEVSEMPDPQWLSNLRAVLDTARHREHQERLEHQQDVTKTEDIQSYSQVYSHDQTSQEPNQTAPVDPNYSMAETTQPHIPLMDSHGMSYVAPSSQPYQQQDSMYGGQPSPDVMDSSCYTNPHSPSKGVEAAPVNRYPQDEGPPASETPMMAPPSPEHTQYPQDTTYQGTYHQQEPYLHPNNQPPNTFEPRSGGGEQSMNNTTTFSQPPNSEGGYPRYPQQDSYQPWGQPPPQPTEGGGMAAPPDVPHQPTEPPAPQTQRTPEEEAYWAEMSNKKEGSDTLKVGKGRGQDWRHGQTHSLKQHEGRTKRVSFKPQASLLQEKKRTVHLPTKDKTYQTRSASRTPITNPTNSVASFMPTRHIPSTENHLIHSVEMVASLPANHPNRIIPFSCIPRTFPPPKPMGHHRLKVPSNPLVFGGSFPIDDPISPRQLGSGSGRGTKGSLHNSPRTYQVDTLCCQAPNLCDEHAKLGHDTELARATARWEAAQNKATRMEEEDGEDGDDEDDDEECDESSLNMPPITTTTATSTTCQLPASSLGFHGSCKNCSGPCPAPCHPAPRQPVLTYPVDGHVEGGLIPLTDDDDYDYQEEEYDEFGGDVYEYEEDYIEEEECEETLVTVEGMRREPATDFHLRHRHPHAATTAAAVSSSPSLDPTTTTTITTNPVNENPASVEISHSNTPSTPLFSPPPLLHFSPPSLLQPPTHPPPPPPPLPSTALVGDVPHPPSPPNCLAPQSGGNNNSKEIQGEETKSGEDKKKSAGKESKIGNANKGGWLTNLLGWKTSTPQAVLPKDDNPQIVWDDDQKKWVNKDGTEEVTAPVGPPPKMPQPGRGLPPRNANRMTRYVDPVRDKGTGSPGTQPPMLPPMPMISPSVSPSLMVPQPMLPTQETKEAADPVPQPQQQHHQQQQQHQQQHQQQQQKPPPNPEVAQGTLSEEPRSAVPMMAPPMGQPQFFDPSKFKPSPGTPVNSARRAGPGRRSFPANR